MKKLLFVLAMLPAVSLLIAQPVNDNPCNAITLAVTSSADPCQLNTSYSLTGATYLPLSLPASCLPVGNNNPDVWFKFTPTAYAPVTVYYSTGYWFSGNLSYIELYTASACNGTYNLVDCWSLDINASPDLSRITASLNAYTEYYVRLIRGASSDDIGLCISTGLPAFSARIGINTAFPQTNLDIAGTVRFRDKVGIGTSVPYAKLDIAGNIKISDGTQGSNKVLTSDGNGLASWQIASTGLWTAAGSNIYNNNSGNIGIGASVPSNKLTVSGNADITGNLGIGTNSPAAKLDVAGPVYLRGSINISHFNLGVPEDTYIRGGKASSRVIINDYAGAGIVSIGSNLGIGTAGAAKPLSFPATLGEKILLYPGGVGEVGIGVYGNELRLHADNSNAKVSFGTQDNNGAFTENAKAERNGVYAFSIFGSLWVNGTTYVSDERFKKNITSISSPLEKLLQLNGVEYEMRTNEFPKNYFQPGRQIGLLAQNVEKIIPEAVNEKDGYKGVDYARLVPLLIEAIKELKKENNEQQKKIEALELRINNK